MGASFCSGLQHFPCHGIFPYCSILIVVMVQRCWGGAGPLLADDAWKSLDSVDHSDGNDDDNF